MTKQSLRWFALALVLGAAACSPGACAQNMVEDAIEADTGAEVNLDAEDGTVTLRGKDGEQMTFSSNEDGVELPSDFPSNIPVYPDARATEYLNTGGGVQVAFQISASMTDVRDWYIEQLKEGDWTIGMNAVTSEGGIMVAEQGDESLSLIFGAEDDETTLIITSGHR